MSSLRSLQPFARHARGALAWLLAGVVLTLSLLTASPALHEHLHAHDHAVAHGDDDGCAITLFGHGVTTPPPLPRIEAPAVRWITPTPPVHAMLPPVAATGLHPPGRGPPCIG